jgi:Mg2+-importing ATPase
MFGVLGASIFLPFVATAPIPVLTNNLLDDFSQVPTPTDDVGPELVARPRPWSMGHTTRFILCRGPVSSPFDDTTFALLWFVFQANVPERQSLFQTGWFVESLLRQTRIIHIIRANRVPFVPSRASWPLMVTTALIRAAGRGLPFSPPGPALGLTPLPARYGPLVALALLCYALLAQLVKTWLARKGWG